MTIPKRRLLMVSFILFFFVALDQVSKKMAISHLKNSRPMSFFHNLVQFLYAENTGSWGGFGANFPAGLRIAFLILFPLIILLFVGMQLFSKHSLSMLSLVSLSLILAGGIGNMIDRLMRGFVVDFMYIGYSNIGTNIFNVADAILMAGMAGLLFDGFFKQKDHRESLKNRT